MSNTGDYSTTSHTGLASTTFKIGGYSHFCIHCCEQAKCVQGLIEDHYDFDITDYRCDCDGAIDEVAKLLALHVIDCPKLCKPTGIKLTEDHLKGAMENSKLTLLELSDKELKVEEGYANGDFLHDMKLEIKSCLTDTFLCHEELLKFMYRVHIYHRQYILQISEELNRVMSKAIDTKSKLMGR